jgi:uncharacterized protein
MILMMLLQYQRQECRRIPHRRLAWGMAAAVNACCAGRHATTEAAAAAAAAAAFLSAVPRRSHHHHHHIEPFALTGHVTAPNTSSCVGSLLAISATRRHDASPSQHPQHVPRIRGRRWLAAKSFSDQDDDAGSKEDSLPGSNRVIKQHKNKKPNIKEKKSDAATASAAVDMAMPPSKSAEELAQDAENVEIERAVRHWLEKVVTGLNLCPFAERPLRTKNQLKIHIVRGNDEHVLLSSMLCALLLQKERDGTTLVVCPECHANDFVEYLNVLNLMEVMLEDHDLVGHLQIAPFHPLFEFEGSSSSSSKNGNNDDDDAMLQNVDNYTNRAPYPIFHILREDEVEQAVEMLQGDAGRVWKRNVRLLENMYQELGAKDYQRVMKPCSTAGTAGTGTTRAIATTTLTQQQQQDNSMDINNTVRDILRRHRIQLTRSSPWSSGGHSDDDEDDDDDDSKD